MRSSWRRGRILESLFILSVHPGFSWQHPAATLQQIETAAVNGGVQLSMEAYSCQWRSAAVNRGLQLSMGACRSQWRRAAVKGGLKLSIEACSCQ